jgi:hypothetical protein
MTKPGARPGTRLKNRGLANSETAVVKTDFHLPGSCGLEVRIHFLNVTAVLKERFDISLQLGSNPGPASNGMVILSFGTPVAGTFQGAFVEITHGSLPSTKTDLQVRQAWPEQHRVSTGGP